MSYTITEDSIQSNTFGYAYSQPDDVTVASAVVVSSTERAGVFSAHADSRLVNNGHIVSASMDEGNGNGVQFEKNGGSVVNAANASIAGFDTGIAMTGNRFAVTNYGEIRGLRGDGDSVGVLIDSSQSFDSGAISIFNGPGGFIGGSFASIVVAGATAGRVSIDNRGILDGGVIMFGGGTNDVVRNPGTIHGDVYLGSGNDVFNGAGGRSGGIAGGEGNDTLAGGNRADVLSGGLGADVLTGRGAADRFYFDEALAPAKNADRITDFTVNVDKICLLDSFAAAGSGGVLAASRFHIGATAADASDRIIYNPNTGAVFFDHDGRGGDPQVKFAQLTAHLALDHGDFLLLGPFK